jgi:hypothetical protein
VGGSVVAIDYELGYLHHREPPVPKCRARIARVAALWLSGLLWAGCGDPNGFERGCDSQVSFSLGSGSAPQIGWSPDCKIGVLAVAKYPLSDIPGQRVPAAEWMIKAGDQFGNDNLLHPILRYGELPSGATAVQGPAPLLADTLYFVQGWVFDLQGNMIGVGETAFRLH